MSLIKRKKKMCKGNVSATLEKKNNYRKMLHKTDILDSQNKVDYFDRLSSKLLKAIVMEDSEKFIRKLYYLREHWASYLFTTPL